MITFHTSLPSEDCASLSFTLQLFFVLLQLLHESVVRVDVVSLGVDQHPCLPESQPLLPHHVREHDGWATRYPCYAVDQNVRLLQVVLDEVEGGVEEGVYLLLLGIDHVDVETLYVRGEHQIANLVCDRNDCTNSHFSEFGDIACKPLAAEAQSEVVLGGLDDPRGNRSDVVRSGHYGFELYFPRSFHMGCHRH